MLVPRAALWLPDPRDWIDLPSVRSVYCVCVYVCVRVCIYGEWRCTWSVLCVGCTTKEIRDRFKKLALKWHPDKNIDSPDEAQKVRIT